MKDISAEMRLIVGGTRQQARDVLTAAFEETTKTLGKES